MYLGRLGITYQKNNLGKGFAIPNFRKQTDRLVRRVEIVVPFDVLKAQGYRWERSIVGFLASYLPNRPIPHPMQTR